MSQETAQVAADLTASILGEAVAKYSGDEVGDNAARMLSEMTPGQDVEAPPVIPAASSPKPAAEAAPQQQETVEAVEEEPELPDFSPHLTDEYKALLEEPDFDEEAAREIEAERDDEVYDPDAADPETAKRIRALEKRNQWLEQQNVNANRGKWIAEAERSFPFLKVYFPEELREIQATSRRAFAREAAKLNDRYSDKFKQPLADLQAARQLAKQEAEAEARKKAAANWGLPAGEGLSASDEEQAAQITAALDKARAERAPLAERLKILGGILPKR